jgi:hypothetical protein
MASGSLALDSRQNGFLRHERNQRHQNDSSSEVVSGYILPSLCLKWNSPKIYLSTLLQSQKSTFNPIPSCTRLREPDSRIPLCQLTSFTGGHVDPLANHRPWTGSTVFSAHMAPHRCPRSDLQIFKTFN